MINPKKTKKNFLDLILKRKKIILVISFFILVLLFLGFKALSAKKSQPQYQTARVERSTIISTVSASGQILSSNIINVATSASGIVKEVFVKDGDQVQVGQRIVEITLDSSGQAKSAQAYSSYLSAKNNLDSANANAYSLRSAKDTAWKKFYDLATSSQYQNSDGSPRDDLRNSSAEFQSAQGDWLAAEAKYKNQQAVISQTQAALTSSWLSYKQSSPQVYAPFSGMIENITAVPGMVLSEQASTTNNANQRVAVIRNDGTPLISVNLSEVDVSKINPGLKATVTLDSIAGKTFTGKVMTVDKIGTVASNVTNYPAVIQLDTQNEQILPNMAISANIIVDTKDNALVVPSTAVQNQNGQPMVRILNNGQLQQVSVETGLSSDTQTEIVSGLSEGNEVVTGTVTPTTTGTQGNSPFGAGGGFGGLRPGGFGGGGGGGARRD